MPSATDWLTRAQLIERLASLKRALDRRRHRDQKYALDQPRVPAGSPEGGQFGTVGTVSDLGGSLDDLRTPDHGFTYSIITHTMPIVGYSVSAHKARESLTPASAITLDTITRYAAANLDLLLRDGNWIGAWHDPETSLVNLDVVTVVYSQAEAVRIGRAHQQKAYYDIGRKQVVLIEPEPAARAAPHGGTHGTETELHDRRAAHWCADHRGSDRPHGASDRHAAHAGGNRPLHDHAQRGPRQVSKVAAQTPAQILAALRLARRLARDLYGDFEDFRDTLAMGRLATAIASGSLELLNRVINWSVLTDALTARLTPAMQEGYLDGAKVSDQQLRNADIAIDFDRLDPAATRYARALSATRIVEITDESRQQVRDLLDQAAATGMTAQEVARDLRNSIGLTDRLSTAVDRYRESLAGQDPDTIDRLTGQYRAQLVRYRTEMIARTEMLHASQEGQLEALRVGIAEGQVNPDRLQLEWIVTADELLCDICRPMDGVRVAWGEPWTLDNGDTVFIPTESHPNCFVPDTRVACEAMAGLKIRYQGPIYTVETARGNRLTVTMNHPIATPNGLCAASSLREGDEVLSDTRPIWQTLGLRDRHDHDAPALIHEVVQALASRGFAASQIGALDLHGDAEFTDRQVYIVGTDRPHIRDCKTARTEDGTERIFHRRTMQQTLIDRARMQASFRQRSGSPARRDPGGAALPLDETPITLEGLPLHEFRFGPTADWHCTLTEAAKQDPAIYPAFARELLERSAGLITPDQIVKITISEYDGHVYDLQTTTGFIIAEGIVTSNCRCAFAHTLVQVDEQGRPYDDPLPINEQLGVPEFVFKDFDESQHPRVDPGSPEGGQFTSAGGAVGLLEGPSLDPQVVTVGGDAWNRDTAVRLESEYQAAKPALDALIDRTQAHEAESGVPTTERFPVFEQPKEWDDLPWQIQASAETQWKDYNRDSFYESELEYWRENDAAVEAGKQVAEDEVWRAEVAQDWIDNYEHPDLPPELTAEVIASAMTFTTNEDFGTSRSGDIEEFEYDESKLVSPSWNPNQQDVPLGLGDATPPSMLTPEMRTDLESVLRESFDDERVRVSNHLDPPDYLQEQAEESLSDIWSEMSDAEKFDYAKENFGDEDGFPASVERMSEPSLFARPTHWASINADALGYQETREFAARLSMERTAQLWEQRGLSEHFQSLSGSHDLNDLMVEVVRLDQRLWQAWLGDSHNADSKVMQLAAARELGGRERFTPEEEQAIVSHASRVTPGLGMAGVQAYVRAKWETTQYILEHSDLPTVTAYRGIMVDKVKEGLDTMRRVSVEAPGDDVWRTHSTVTKLPDFNIARNGLASFTMKQEVANRWEGVGIRPQNPERVVIRAEVPRTAVLSLPVYGKNDHNEEEIVIAGVAWKNWDAYLNRAPNVRDVPVKSAGAVSREWLWREGERVYFDIARYEDALKLPHWLSELRAQPIETKLFDEALHPRDEHGQFTDAGGGDSRITQQMRDRYTWHAPTGDGDHYFRVAPYVTDDIALAVELLRNGLVVELTDSRSVYTLLTKLADIANEAKAKGEKAPNFNLCNVTVAGTNLFCADRTFSHDYPAGVPRREMPQLAGFPEPGSESDGWPRDTNGEVDGSQQFIDWLHHLGIDVHRGQRPASRLRATQAELIGTKVAGMMLNPQFSPGAKPIFISKDQYIIDGHHRWAALVGRETHSGHLGTLTMNVNQVDAPVTELLDLARYWTHGVGLRPKEAKALAAWLIEHKDFDESLHPRDEAGLFIEAGGSGLVDRETGRPLNPDGTWADVGGTPNADQPTVPARVFPAHAYAAGDIMTDEASHDTAFRSSTIAEQALERVLGTRINLFATIEDAINGKVSPNDHVLSVGPDRNSLRAAVVTADVLREMKALGYKMPTDVLVHSPPYEPQVNLVTSWMNPTLDNPEGRTLLVVNIPRGAPTFMSLDNLALAAFSEYTDEGVRKFVPRSFAELVVHEVGHLQAGLRAGTSVGAFSVYGDSDAHILTSARLVSDYAAKNADEFLAEAFTAQFRGETLQPDAQLLYDRLNGPTVRR